MINKKSVLNIVGVIVLSFVSVIAVMITAVTVSARTVVYIANADSREIYVLELDEKSGNVKIIEKVPVAGTVMPLAISPDQKYLYASLRSEPYSVSSFAIDPTSGKLTLIKTVPLADNMAYISIDHTGNYLFGASYSGSKISVNAISNSGAVSSTPLQVIPTGKNAHCILTDPSNKFLFASNLGADVILQYQFDEASGRLMPNNPPSVETKKGAGPRHFVFTSNRHFVFSTNELDGTLNTYRLDNSGRLALINSTSVMPAGSNAKPWAADLHLTPDGKFLYASERTTSTLTAFRVDNKNGKLTSTGSYATEEQPRGFNIVPGGKYLLAVGQKSNKLSVYEINRKTGTLKKLSQTDVGKNPNWVEIISLP